MLFILLSLYLCALPSLVTSTTPMTNTTGGSLRISGDDLLLNGKPFRLLSGAFHYFRTPRENWRDRLHKIRHAGLNTVETYLPWNLHEPRPGEFDFDGDLDVEAFFKEAHSIGLFVIARPGPYICAEWEMGGLPAWLLTNGTEYMKLRSRNRRFLEPVDRYLDTIAPLLLRHSIDHGGPIIMLQIENEYMSYGRNHDVSYIEYLRDAYIKRGVDPNSVVFFTSDNTDAYLSGPDDVLRTANFGAGVDVRHKLATLRRDQPKGPLIVMEFWCGWFDMWDSSHTGSPVDRIIPTLKSILASGAHVNFYVFVGGTSFGFFSGANFDLSYRPQTTSYDYDAPITESGDLTDKYWALRKIILDYASAPSPSSVISTTPKQDLGRITFTESIKIFDALPQLVPSGPIFSHYPQHMERYGQNYGLILYRTIQNHTQDIAIPIYDVTLKLLHDRAHVFIDETFQGIAFRVADHVPPTNVPVSLPHAPATVRIDILVENMGRVNFGDLIADAKGIESVTLGHYGYGRTLTNFEIYPITLDPSLLLNLRFTPIFSPFFYCLFPSTPPPFIPTFYRANFNIDGPPQGDTFLRLPNFSKGLAWVNNRPLGRYWRIGPQRTLYIPKPYLRSGKNNIVVLELDGLTEDEIMPEGYLDDSMQYGAGGSGRKRCGPWGEQLDRKSPFITWIPLALVVLLVVKNGVTLIRRRGYKRLR